MEVDLHLSSICRLCADFNSNGTVIFDESSSEGDIASFINAYLPFKVQNDGKLPQTICPGCNIQLQATVQFFDLCIEGQKKIRGIWKEQVTRRRRQDKETGDSSGLEINIGGVEHSYSQETAQLLDDVTIDLLTNVEQQLSVEVFDENGMMFPIDDPLVLRAEGLEKPRRKRGRPKKMPKPEPEVFEESETPEPEACDFFKRDERYDDGKGRKRRRRKVPVRYKEAVQGKELERILKEEGVTDEDSEAAAEVTEQHAPVTAVETGLANKVIGHLETQEGQDLGEVVIVNKVKAKRKCSLRKKIRYQCEICGKGFLHQGRYLFHKSAHKGVKFECTTCEKRFTTRENFELHQRLSRHTGEGIIESLDEKIVRTEEKFDDLSDKIAVNCSLCEKSFESKTSYESHLVSEHKNAKPFQCTLCQKSFTQLSLLKSHVATHDESGGGTKEKGYPCGLCDKRLNHPSSVLYHREAEHNNGRRFVCNKCGKMFKHKQLLQRHQLVHSDNRPFGCAMCQASFKTKANLMNHQATHTGEKKHKCEHCGQQFAHKTSLTLHYRWHSGQKPYQCNVCKKMFSQKGNLQEHQRIHTGEKPFTCNLCSRKFTTSSQFKLHIKRHTGERPWKCEFCGKSFLHKDAWKCHVRRHKGEKPFRCTHCEREFPEQWALKKHMRLHTGERPYSCTICGKRFADCSNLTKHKKVHAKDGISSKLEMGADDQTTADGVELSVWNIIQTHLQEAQGGLDKAGVKASPNDDVQQIIYVTYQDSDQCNVTVKTKDESSDNFILPSIDEVGVGGEGVMGVRGLQVTDDQGNPIHFTMQDGSALQITTTDGQNLQVTTKDGQVIPVQITPEGAEIVASPAGLEIPVVGSDLSEDTMHPLEFTTAEGQKFKIIPPYLSDNAIDAEYLNIA